MRQISLLLFIVAVSAGAQEPINDWLIVPGERVGPIDSVSSETRLRTLFGEDQIKEGIGLGTSLKQIEALNGYPFRLAGFAFDYGGTVLGCPVGRLHALGCDSSERNLIVRFYTNGSQQPQAYRQVIGDREFSSGHLAMQALNPVIGQLIVTIDAE